LKRGSATVVASGPHSSRAEIARVVARSLARGPADMPWLQTRECRRIYRLFPINLAYGDTAWRYEPKSRSADM